MEGEASVKNPKWRTHLAPMQLKFWDLFLTNKDTLSSYIPTHVLWVLSTQGTAHVTLTSPVLPASRTMVGWHVTGAQ